MVSSSTNRELSARSHLESDDDEILSSTRPSSLLDDNNNEADDSTSSNAHAHDDQAVRLQSADAQNDSDIYHDNDSHIADDDPPSNSSSTLAGGAQDEATASAEPGNANPNRALSFGSPLSHSTIDDDLSDGEDPDTDAEGGSDHALPDDNAQPALSPSNTWRPQNQQSTCEFSHVITNYSKKRESGCKKAEYSPITVDSYGNRWRLIVYVNGNGRASNHHLSLFLQVADSDDLPFGWKKAVSYVLTLEHPSGNRNNSLGYSKRNPDKTFKLCPKAIDWGWSQFITSDRIQQEGYINNDSLTVRATVTVKSSSVNIDPADAELYLKYAVEEGKADAVKSCLEQGAGVNCQFKDDLYTPLHTACSSSSSNGSLEVLNLLLDRGADANACNKWRETPLLIAANNGHRAAVEALLDHGADPSMCSEAGWSALTFAAHKGYHEIVELLLESGAPVNCQVTEDLSTPLHKACAGGKSGHLSAVKQLIDGGADVHALNKWRETPLLTAANHGQANAVEALLEAGADPCKCTDTGWSPLSIAAYKGHDEVVRLLLEEGAPTEEADPTLSALLQAATKGLPKTVELLLAHGADHTVTTKKGDTALSILVEQNLIDAAVEMVTEYKASVPRCSRDRKKVQRARLLINLRVKQQEREGRFKGGIDSDDGTDDSEQDDADDESLPPLHDSNGVEVPASPGADKLKPKKKKKKGKAGGAGKSSKMSAEEAAKAAEEELLRSLEEEDAKAQQKETDAKKKGEKKRKKKERDRLQKLKEDRERKEREEAEAKKREQQRKIQQEKERKQKLQREKEMREQAEREEELERLRRAQEESERRQREQEKKDRERAERLERKAREAAQLAVKREKERLAKVQKTKNAKVEQAKSSSSAVARGSSAVTTGSNATVHMPSTGKTRGWETKTVTPPPVKAPTPPIKRPVQNPQPAQQQQPQRRQPQQKQEQPPQQPKESRNGPFSVEDHMQDMAAGVVDFLDFDSSPHASAKALARQQNQQPAFSRNGWDNNDSNNSNPVQVPEPSKAANEPTVAQHNNFNPEPPAVAIFREQQLAKLLRHCASTPPVHIIGEENGRLILNRWIIRASHGSTSFLDPMIPSWTDEALLAQFFQRQLISISRKSGSGFMNMEILKEAGAALASNCVTSTKELIHFRSQCMQQVPNDWNDNVIGLSVSQVNVGGSLFLKIDWSGHYVHITVPTFESLKRRYTGQHDKFFSCVYAMVKRYDTLRALSGDLSVGYRIPSATALSLTRELGVTVNARSDAVTAFSDHLFCGMFADVDAFFGGFPTFGKEGGGGEAMLQYGGSCMMLPPLESTTSSVYIKKALDLIESSDARVPLSFAILLPSECFRELSTPPSISNLPSLDPRLGDPSSGVLRHVELLGAGNHIYQGGIGEGINHISQTGSLFVLLQNHSGKLRFPVDDSAIGRIISSMSLNFMPSEILPSSSYQSADSVHSAADTPPSGPSYGEIDTGPAGAPIIGRQISIGNDSKSRSRRGRLFELEDNGEDEGVNDTDVVSGMLNNLDLFGSSNQDVDVEAFSLLGIGHGNHGSRFTQ